MNEYTDNELYNKIYVWGIEGIRHVCDVIDDFAKITAEHGNKASFRL